MVRLNIIAFSIIEKATMVNYPGDGSLSSIIKNIAKYCIVNLACWQTIPSTIETNDFHTTRDGSRWKLFWMMGKM